MAVSLQRCVVSFIAVLDNLCKRYLRNRPSRFDPHIFPDDKDEVRSFFKDAPDMAGYQIIEAIDGNDALETYSSTENIDPLLPAAA